MDYNELGEHAESKAKLTTIICRDKWVKATVANVVKANGSTECANRIVDFWGSSYSEIAFKSGNDGAIKVLGGEIASKRKRPTRPGCSVPMRPQTHGRAEKAVQDVMDQIRNKSSWVLRRESSQTYLMSRRWSIGWSSVSPW